MLIRALPKLFIKKPCSLKSYELLFELVLGFLEKIYLWHPHKKNWQYFIITRPNWAFFELQAELALRKLALFDLLLFFRYLSSFQQNFKMFQDLSPIPETYKHHIMRLSSAHFGLAMVLFLIKFIESMINWMGKSLTFGSVFFCTLDRVTEINKTARIRALF